MPGEDSLWIFDEGESTIRMNIRHPSWTTLEEEGDIALCKLQETIATHVIVSLSKDPKDRSFIRELSDEIIHLDVLLIKYGSSSKRG